MVANHFVQKKLVVMEDWTLARTAELARADVKACSEGQPPAGRADACETAPFVAATGVPWIATDAALCARTRSDSAYCQDIDRRVDVARERLHQVELRFKESMSGI